MAIKRDWRSIEQDDVLCRNIPGTNVELDARGDVVITQIAVTEGTIKGVVVIPLHYAPRLLTALSEIISDN